MPLQLSVVDFLATACYMLIFTFFWRIAAAKLHATPLGRAMAAVYS